jgi:predicted ferric reductase
MLKGHGIYKEILLVILVIGLAYICNAITHHFYPTTENGKDATNGVKVWVERDIGGEPIVGSQGLQMRVMAKSDKPVSITYTVKYKTAVVYPGAIPQEVGGTQTVSIQAGTTKLQTFNAIDGKVDVSYTVK